jgi:hypothetical protein
MPTWDANKPDTPAQSDPSPSPEAMQAASDYTEAPARLYAYDELVEVARALDAFAKQAVDAERDRLAEWFEANAARMKAKDTRVAELESGLSGLYRSLPNTGNDDVVLAALDIARAALAKGRTE